MKKLLLILLASLALAGCQREKGPDLDREFLLSLKIKAPSGGPMSLAADPFAIKDEARINFLGIYIFGPKVGVNNPQSTDDFVLEGVFFASGPETAELTTGTEITKSGMVVNGETVKHIYFSANVELSVSHKQTTESEMLRMLAHELGTLPIIDSITPGDPASKLEVKGDGIPMSAFAEVDCTQPGIEQLPVSVQLKRTVARFDVTNSTRNYRILSARAVAYDRALLFDTTGWQPLPTLPATSFPLDYPVSAESAEMPMVSRVIEPMLEEDETADPQAMGYLWPTPAGHPTKVLIDYQKIDTGEQLPGLQPGPVGTMVVEFTRGGVADTVIRNRVYRITLHEQPNTDLDGSFEAKDWQVASFTPQVPVVLQTTLKFTGGTGGTFAQTGSATSFTMTGGAGSTGTLTLDAGGKTPIVADGNRPIPSWLKIGGQTGSAPTNAIFSPSGDFSEIQLEIVTANSSTSSDNIYTLWVTINQGDAPTSNIRIIQPRQ